MRVLYILLGGAFGTGCRYGLSMLIYSKISHPEFPYATFIINITGSFLIGLLAELFDHHVRVPVELRAALITGVLGGYTTFSSFSLETLSLLREGMWMRALFNSAGSVLLGLIAAWLGVRLAQAL